MKLSDIVKISKNSKVECQSLEEKGFKKLATIDCLDYSEVEFTMSDGSILLIRTSERASIYLKESV